MRVCRAREWLCGAIGVGLTIASGCGGGPPRERVETTTTRTVRTIGAETPRARIVEVDEGQLPIPTHVVAVAPATPAPRARAAPRPALPLTSREGAETEAPPQTWAAQRSMTSQPGEMRAPETVATPSGSAQAGIAPGGASAQTEMPPGGRATAESHALPVPARAEERAVQVSIESVCPSDVPTLRARARNLSRGVALVLTARGEADVARVREHMRQFALLHAMERERQRRIARGESVDPSTVGEAHLADPASPILRVAELRLIEIPDGVRVELVEDAGAGGARIRDLRASVREDAASLREGICPLDLEIA